MGGTHVGRAETHPFRIVPEGGKVLEDNVEPTANESPDVLGPDDGGPERGDDSGVLFPEATLGPSDPGTLPGVGDVGAREAASDEIHDSTPRERIEGGNVVPFRSRIQDLVFHPCHEVGRGVSVPLDITHGLIGSSEDKIKASFETGNTGE
jgi:hypothetical protein